MDVRNEVNCKSCGSVVDVSEDPENWQLQCDTCKKNGVLLPKGYEKVDDKHKVASL